MGQCIDRLKDKSKEKTCIQGGKQPVRKKQTRKTKFERQDTQKSLLFLFYSPSSVLERHSISKLETFISSFPKMTKMGSTEIITQLKKK